MNIQSGLTSHNIRVIHVEDKTSKVAHCGWIINTGSRDENIHQHGLAHFIEHVLFKGTQKRKVHHILNRMEVVGGELNAYTSKEDICIYSSFLNEFYPRAIELLSDICFHSVFSEKEIEKEKEVVLDEINSYLDNPFELIYEEFDELLLPNDPLGRPILGTSKSVKNIKRDDIVEFVRDYFTPENMVFASIGNISINKVLKLLNRYVEIPKNLKKTKKLKLQHQSVLFETSKSKNIHQTHILFGIEAIHATHNKSIALSILNNMLGGPVMNSKLNMILREKLGITYHTESTYTPFTDYGIFNIYVGTDEKNVPKTKQIIRNICDEFCSTLLPQKKLEQAKKQYVRQFMMSLDQKSNLILSLGKSLALLNKIETPEEIINKIEGVTSSDILECAKQTLNYHKFSILHYIPK